jgi:hypothetical protein
MAGSRHDDDTKPFSQDMVGNELYHRAMFAIGLAGAAVSAALTSTLRAIGSTPATLVIDDLGAMLPEIERRLLLMAPHEDVVKAMVRLRKLVLEWGP